MTIFHIGKGVGLCKGFLSAITYYMLILTRKAGETITIGDNVHIKVLSMKGGQVRIGIDAPQSVSIYRDEIYSKQDGLKHLDMAVDTTVEIAETQVTSKA